MGGIGLAAGVVSAAALLALSALGAFLTTLAGR